MIIRKFHELFEPSQFGGGVRLLVTILCSFEIYARVILVCSLVFSSINLIALSRFATSFWLSSISTSFSIIFSTYSERVVLFHSIRADQSVSKIWKISFSWKKMCGGISPCNFLDLSFSRSRIMLAILLFHSGSGII